MAAPSTHGTYPYDDGRFAVFPSRRSVVHGTKGIVSTTSPLATEAGLRILRAGGNAADAAVAAAAVLNLVDPAMTGIGGDAFALYYSSGKVLALNGSGRSAAGATLGDVCRDLGVDSSAGNNNSIPTSSALSVTVPGAAGLWVDLVGRLGSGRVTLAEVLAPAIEMAEEGAAVSELASYYFVASEAELRNRPNGAELLKPDPSAPGGFRAPRAGEVYKNPLLAKTFRLLAEGGRQGFYEGPVAQAIVDATTNMGGYLTLDDLKRHGEKDSDITAAIPMRLNSHVAPKEERRGEVGRGVIDLWEHPPNGQGIVAQMALGILQELIGQGTIAKFEANEHNSARYLNAVIQSLRIAFTDGSWFITDPSTSPTPTPQSLISQTYLASRAKLFDPSRCPSPPPHGDPSSSSLPHRTSDTVQLAVTDVDGNGCSLVNSVADTFGSRIAPAGCGFALHSRGSGFHLDAGHPNVYAPGKRPYNTIIPAVVTRAPPARGPGDGDGDGDRDAEALGGAGLLHTVFGVMGGAMQPQGHVQVLLNMVMFGMNPQVALDAPRICIGVSLPGKSTDPSKSFDNRVYLEEGIGEEVGGELDRMGHEVVYVRAMGRSLFGRGQVIRVHDDPVYGQRIHSGGSDMRGDGMAAPLV